MGACCWRCCMLALVVLAPAAGGGVAPRQWGTIVGSTHANIELMQAILVTLGIVLRLKLLLFGQLRSITCFLRFSTSRCTQRHTDDTSTASAAAGS